MHWLIALVVLIQLTFPTLPREAEHLPRVAEPLPQVAAPIHSPAAQSSLEITDLGVTYQFGEQITFKARVQPVADLQEMLIFIAPENQSTVWQKVDLSQINDQGELAQSVDARQITLTPFSKVSYRYEVKLKDGSTQTSETKTFSYEDNRFTWQYVKSGIFDINWNGSDTTLGQELANIAQQGLDQAKDYLAATPPDTIRIYAYSSSSDMQKALQLSNQPWVAGHTAPELGLILVSIPSGPEKKLEMQRQVPHEIMHILQYQVVGKGYDKQPVWLIEGMASVAELYPDPDYSRVLEATNTKDLIPFASLCSAFPREAAAQYLAYAQSESFVRFLNNKYGSTGLRKLIDQYQTGIGCDEGFMAATGVSLEQAEYRWKQESLGVNVQGLVLTNLSPYLLLGLLILIPAALVFFPYHQRSEDNA